MKNILIIVIIGILIIIAGILFKKSLTSSKNIETELKKQDNLNNNDYIKTFLEVYKPSNNLEKPNQKILKFGDETLPKEIIELWTEYGFGNYCNGIIKVINPEEYMGSFYKWLGKEDFNKIPILMTGFGDIFFYDRTNNEISFLDIHYGKITQCVDSFEVFFGQFLIDENIKYGVLKEDLFSKALEKVGSIKNNEIYFFVPALVLGGKQDIKNIKKGDASTHQHLLYNLNK